MAKKHPYYIFDDSNGSKYTHLPSQEEIIRLDMTDRQWVLTKHRFFMQHSLELAVKDVDGKRLCNAGGIVHGMNTMIKFYNWG